nr:aminotransferase class I/II-fold pyridoxal phosphate-dependent enzyme [uncultured Mediterraneibacter sp.]
MKIREAQTQVLKEQRKTLKEEYQKYMEQGLSLNIGRGLPCKEQLDLNAQMFHLPEEDGYLAEDGTDCRNYGVMYGLPECIRLFSKLLDIPEENIILGGESCLNLMYDQFLRYYTFGSLGEEPWGVQAQKKKLKWLCPVPGYDCHFNLTEALGFEMINIPLLPTGPDMDLVEKLVAEDESVKGIWCVPQYSNPTGTVYSDETVERLARMKTAAKDFKIFWDNAYAVHHLYQEHIVKDLLKESRTYHTEDRVLYFFSTAKITFPGSGVCLIASGDRTIEETKKLLKLQIFSHDKLNQLRHVKYLKDPETIRAHMKEIAGILRPKFDLVDQILKEHRLYEDVYQWEKPDGGYFITLDSMEGCAKKILKMTEEAGVIVATPAATYPYHKDPKDSTIRLAPTYPPMEELKKAMELFTVCANIAAIEKVLEEREKA